MPTKALIVLLIVLSLIFGFGGGILAIRYYSEISNLFPQFFPQAETGSSSEQNSPVIVRKEVTTNTEQAIIDVVNKSLPSVVSIIVKGEVSVPGFPLFSQKIEGGGSGFIVSPDGMILTNKHVVQYEKANYTVVLQNGEEYSAKVLAKDPVQDLAILKINKTGLRPLPLGDSDNLKVGQTVIAIGYALGEFQNSVSVGVVSGLSRRITASGGGITETIGEVIQTDAAINKGNSGGPLLNLSGEVIGINTAMASGAENIGFAIPINKAKKAIKETKEKGKITYPFLGVRYILIDKKIKTQYNLPVDYGAWVVRGKSPEEVAVTPGSGAEKAGIKENDIILEVDGKKVTKKNTLADIILSYNPGDKIRLKILRAGKEIEVVAELGERQ